MDFVTRLAIRMAIITVKMANNNSYQEDSNIEVLSLMHIKDYTDFSGTFSQYPNVKHLVLKGYRYRYSHKDLNFVLSHFSKVEFVNIMGLASKVDKESIVSPSVKGIRLGQFSTGLHLDTLLPLCDTLEYIECTDKLYGVGALGAFHNMKVCTLTKTPLKDLSAFGNVNHLKELTLRRCSLLSLNGLGDKDELEVLGLACNKITDTSALGEHSYKSLRQISLSENKSLGNLEALSGLPFKALFIQFCGTVDSVRPLASCKNMNQFDGTGTLFKDTDFMPVLNLPKIGSCILPAQYRTAELEAYQKERGILSFAR